MQIHFHKPDLHDWKKKLKHPMVVCFLVAFGLNLFVETMSRCSLFGAFEYLFTNPLVFLYNTVIIAATLSITLLFRKRTFAMTFVSLLWIIIGITDFVLLQFRTTPFTAVDILMVKSAIEIWQYYLSVFQLVLIAAAVVLLIIGLIFLWKKTKRVTGKLSYIKVLVFCGITFLSSFFLTEAGLKTTLLAANFGNLADAFHDYGLPYCFVNSIINTGIDKPKHYSSDVVNQIVNAVEEGVVVKPSDIVPTEEPVATPTPTPSPTPTIVPEETLDSHPNIIMVQLESFFDPAHITGVTFTSDPVPVYRNLVNNYSSGYLNVPSVGAGTANTEFEIITGMNLDFFGPGEYPYKTILQETTCESVNFNLKTLDYTTHAIHNNTGTFYDRNKIFSQLGFDTFTSIEYMNNIERTPLGWAKDEVLIGEIDKALKDSEGQDFIYTISVQGHGSYPTEPILENPEIDITIPEHLSSDLYYPLLYYVNQIHEMDDFIADLIDYIDSLSEDTILIMYGDHLPGFKLDASDLDNESLFQTQYVMYSNFPMETIHKDLESYQLYSYVLERLGISVGLIPKLHQTQQDSEVYLDELKILEYDMLYGDLDCYDGVNPNVATNLQMGIDPITINNVQLIPVNDTENENICIVTGDNFTPYSKIYINDSHVETTFQDSHTLTASDVVLAPGDKVTVVQSGTDMVILSSTDPWIQD